MGRTLVIWVALLGLLAFPSVVQAKVTGLCSNCHTMHYSQHGSVLAAWGSGGPYQYLLINDCIGCHSNSSGNATIVSGTPMVLTSTEPTYPPDGSSSSALAGGNFYWLVNGNDTLGHNVYGLPGVNQDSNLGTAPGLPSSCSCHSTGMTLGFSSTRKCNGCDCCHDPAHHQDEQTDPEYPVVGTSTSWPAPYFRFLGFYDGKPHPWTFMESNTGFYGGEGIEDPDWEQNPTSSSHNEYAGASGSDYTHSISKYCAACHGVFHQDTGGSSPWLRHPTDYAIPNSGEYSNAFGASGGTGTYDPQVPVSRPDLSGYTGPSSTVTLGTDQVQCLSCHRAHGSPYPYMLRWDYKSWPGGGTNGCAVCHTSKD